MKKIFIIAALFSFSLFAAEPANIAELSDKELSVAEKKMIKAKQEQEAIAEEERQRQDEIKKYVQELNLLANQISKEKVWMKSYASYLTSLDVRENLEKIKKRINYLRKNAKHVSEKDELTALISKEKILTSQIEKLKEKDSAPFSKLLTPPHIEEIPNITNPFDIFTGISLIKNLEFDFDDYVKRKEQLTDLISLLAKEKELYQKMNALEQDDKYKEELIAKEKQLERFETALDTIIATEDVYQKRLEIIDLNINKDLEKQVWRLVNISIVIVVVLIFFFLLKQIVKKYITDNERFYMANKIITFTNVTLIILILFFNYIENVSYLVTILGFASAGIAIAMKDWFMSILGWLVIVVGGSIHVGDRIRVDMDGMQYVGDVMDISLLRMTILEDITLTSVTTNRRAGRIIFIPNNYVFTRMIANYTHSTLKTVWDGVSITVTFDPNHKKAMHLTKEITKKYSKGYTDITRKQLNKLRNHYSLKNTNVEPRIFTFINPSGVTIDAWYLTNAYATLTLRSVMSLEIVDAFNAESDITIAYPTQMLHLEKPAKSAPPLATPPEDV